jgi:hypothetical protein
MSRDGSGAGTFGAYDMKANITAGACVIRLIHYFEQQRRRGVTHFFFLDPTFDFVVPHLRLHVPVRLTGLVLKIAQALDTLLHMQTG